jgi:hypothetical protein
MIHTFKGLAALFLMAILLSCNKENFAPAVDFKYNFYPLALTKVLVYKVDSTAYDSYANTVKNFKFQIKDSVANSYTDGSNRTAYRIERYKKLPNETVWRFQKTISRVLTPRNAEETINNKTYVRLVFPPQMGALWNANSKNNLEKQDFSITEIYDSFSLNNLSFNSTLVTYTEDINLIRENTETHTYAQDVGLIASDVRVVELNILTQNITNGFFYTMKLIAYN